MPAQAVQLDMTAARVFPALRGSPQTDFDALNQGSGEI
jgi:hypothetical protein